MPLLNVDQNNLFVQGEVAAINSRPLREDIADSLDLTDFGTVNSTQVGSTSLIQIIATAPSARQAAEVANAAASAYSDRRLAAWGASYKARLEVLEQQAARVRAQLTALNAKPATPDADSERAALQEELTRILSAEGALTGTRPTAGELSRVVEPAQERSASPTSSWKRLTLVAALVGGVTGLAIAIALSRRRRRIVDLEDVGILAPLPVLLSLPTDTSGQGTLSDLRVTSPRSGLTTNLQISRLDLGAAPRQAVLVVVSPSGGAGTTFVAARIAAASATLGPTLVVCAADVLEAKNRARLGVDANAPGIRDVYNRLLGSDGDVVDLSDVIVPTSSPNISLLPAGTPAERGKNVLEPIALPLLKAAGAASPRVIVDAPSLDSSGVALEWARRGAAVVLVIGLGVTCADDAAAAADELERLDAGVLGVVVNSPPRTRGRARRRRGGRRST
jgi:Mrp family chromosome partitioning ATPase